MMMRIFKIKAYVRYFLSIFIFSSNEGYEKYFLFHIKSSFLSRDIQIFCNFFPSFPHFPDSKRQIEVE